MRLYDERGVPAFIHNSLIGNDPNLVERVDRQICRAVKLAYLHINLLPEFLSQILLRINERGRKLFQNVILSQKITPHFRYAKFIRDDAIFFIGRQVDPKVIFRDRQGGQEIFY